MYVNMNLLFAANIVIFFFLCCGNYVKITFLKVYLFVFQYVSYYQMNNKQNKTYRTPPNKQHTQPKQDGGEGSTPHRNYMVQTPLPKKIKKFQKKISKFSFITSVL